MKADVVALAQIIACDQADTGQLNRYYDDTVYELSRETDWISNLSLVVAVAGTAVYELPTDGVRLLTVYWDDRELPPTGHQGLRTYYGADWSARHGNPRHSTTEDENERSFRLVPAPDRASAPFIPVFFSPLGRDYPAESIPVAHTEWRTDVPKWIEFYLVFRILTKEFARDSDHQDLDFSNACQAIASVLFELIR